MEKMKDKATSPEPKRAYCTEPDGCPWTACDCPLKTSSPEHQDKPIGERFENEFGTRSDYFNHRLGLFMDMRKWIEQEFSSLESAYKIELRANETLRTEHQKLQGELKALREEMERLKNEREDYGNCQEVIGYVKCMNEKVDPLQKSNERLVKERDKFAIEFCDWFNGQSWELDYNEQRSHTMQEHLDHFINYVRKPIP